MISIVMPTFKYHMYIEQAIDSILSQSYKDIELIVVPVYQDKRTIGILKSYKDPRLMVVISNYAHITHQMNLGALSAMGEYFMFFGSDDVLEAGILLNLYNYAVRKKAILVYPDYYMSNKHLSNKKKVKTGEHSNSRLKKGCYITDSSLCQRNILFKYLPMKFASGKSRIWDVWKQISANDGKIFHYKHPSYIYRQHSKGVHKKKSQKNFVFVVAGYNDKLEKFYRKIPRVKPIEIKEKHYSVYFPDPNVFLKDKNIFKYKKIILHWDKDNIDLIDEVVDLKYVYSITHDDEILEILNNKKVFNIEFINDENDLLDYLTEERYR